MGVLIIVGTVKGAFLVRSDDKRNSWTVDGPHFKGWKVTTASRNSNGEYFLATASDTYGHAIHRSADLENWTQIVDGPKFEEEAQRKLNQIWFLATEADDYYAGVDEAGLFKSTNHGDSWLPVSGLNEHETRSGWCPGAGGMCAHAFLRDSQNPDRMWCGISAVGVFRTEDGGQTWTPKNQGIKVVIPDEDDSEIGFCVHALAQDPDDPNVIWQQNHSGMYRTRDGGDRWESIQNGLPSTFGFPIVVDPHTKWLYSFPLHSDEFRLPVDGKCQVYRSQDQGDSWHPLGNGLPESRYHAGVLRGAMDIDGHDPCGIYFGTTSGTVHYSNDRGEQWQSLPDIFPRILTVKVFSESDA
ncbi:MAG: exo-alpha-sialidase [Bacteroidetes bacterium]|nr:exo-alpha-sialidase [Bacteroidota bacterium]